MNENGERESAFRRWSRRFFLSLPVVGLAVVFFVPRYAEQPDPPVRTIPASPTTTDAGGSDSPGELIVAGGARYVDADGRGLSPDHTLAARFAEELRVGNPTANILTQALGLRDEAGSEGSRLFSQWNFGGGAYVRAAGGSIAIFCGSDNAIKALVSDGIVVCHSTLEEIQGLVTAGGIGDFELFEEDVGVWSSCDLPEVAGSFVLKARFSFGVGADAESPGVSAADAAVSDVVNGFRVTACLDE